VGAGALSRAARITVPLGLLVLLAAVPYISLDTRGVFSSPLDSPGTLQLLGLCLVFGGVALTYDLLFGFTGLLSFGHALYFAIGVYVANIALTRWQWELWQALLLTAVVGLVVPIVLGSVSLRVGGIAFAMVTLAFAQAGNVLVHKNPDNLTGGDEGLGLDFLNIPEAFVGVFNTKHLYWLALGYLAAVVLIAWWAVNSSPGRVWPAIRENELRVQVLGLRPFWFKLTAFVLGSFLATAGGVVYLLLIGGSSPEVTTAGFTLTLLVMVVLGGSGTLWGPVIGGILYTFLDNRLVSVAGSEDVQSLPAVLSTPLSEPLFVLGTLFILVVFFLPGGIAGIATRGRGRPRGLRALGDAVGVGGSHGGVVDEADETPPSEAQR
jgi:branched-chain amino acid transport system permease protein